MSDLSAILPSFAPSSPAAAHLLSAAEALPLTTADLLALDALDIARRLGAASRSSVLDIKRFVATLAAALHEDMGVVVGGGEGGGANGGINSTPTPQPSFITTGDAGLDTLFGGGIPTQHITEFVGESGAGKSQFLLTLTLTSQLPAHLGGLGRPSVYISTEAPLSTKRLHQLLDSLRTQHHLPPAAASTPSTDRIFSITCNDLEAQDHIIRYQLPVLAATHNVGLIVVDSIAANFRAEFERPVNKRLKPSPSPTPPSTTTTSSSSTPVTTTTTAESGPAQMARRSADLVSLARILRGLARRHNLAVVVANQVSDRFTHHHHHHRRPIGGAPGEMGLDFQARWFSGWGESEGEGESEDRQAKVPALGLVWANVLAARVVVRRSGGREEGRRGVRVVFAPWVRGGVERGFEIVEGGVRGLEDG